MDTFFSGTTKKCQFVFSLLLLFYRYLKCEMYNPLFTPRFGVLLEAYLKGCGESMLTRFENQMEMQTKLEEIGKQV